MMEALPAFQVLSCVYQSLNQRPSAVWEMVSAHIEQKTPLQRECSVQSKYIIDVHAAFLLKRLSYLSNSLSRLGSPYKTLDCFCVSTSWRKMPAGTCASENTSCRPFPMASSFMILAGAWLRRINPFASY